MFECRHFAQPAQMALGLAEFRCQICFNKLPCDFRSDRAAAHAEHVHVVVLHTLARVDEVFQAPVTLFYLQDCSYNEIADILGVPLGTVKSRLARGIAQLQQLLARDIAAGQRPSNP